MERNNRGFVGFLAASAFILCMSVSSGFCITPEVEYVEINPYTGEFDGTVTSTTINSIAVGATNFVKIGDSITVSSITITGWGTLQTSDGTGLDGEVWKSNGAGTNASWQTDATAAGGGDNLGNHIATTTIIMGNNSLTGANDIAGDDFAAVYGITGSSVVTNDLTVDTTVFFVDATNNYIGIGSSITNTVNQLHILLHADKDILVDGSTNPRTIDTGLMRFEQTPAIENTRAIAINLDINDQATSHAQVTNIVASGLVAGETATAYDVNVDRATSTGGIVRGYEMSIAGLGTAVGHLIHADPGVVPLSQFSGAFINIEQAWDENGGFTDVTTAFNTSNPSGPNNVTLFNTNGDMVHIGMDSAFNQMEVNLETFAGGAGIKPVFEYSSGGGTPVWTVFTPQDETQGFRQNGVINWGIDDLITPTWAVATINSVSKFYIRITRTQASIPVDPVEDTIQISVAVNYFWDENGKIFSGSITTGSRSNTITTEGVAETSKMIAHVNDAFSETIEHTLMRHSDTASSGAVLYGIRSRGTHASQTTVADNDMLFHLRATGHDGTDFNDAASIIFDVDGGVSSNDMPGRIEFWTTPDGSNALALALTLDSSQNAIFSGNVSASAVISTCTFAQNSDLLDGHDSEFFVSQSSGTTEHAKALLTDGSRALAGAWDMDDQAVTNINIDSGRITGIVDLAVPDGGTGSGSFTDHGVLLGSGSGALSVTGTGSSGEVLTSNGSSSDPTFQTSVHTVQGLGMDLAGRWDLDSDMEIAHLDPSVFPSGIIITSWTVSCNVADPTTELNANLMYCDALGLGAFPGSNPTLIDVLDSTTGNSNENDMSNSNLGSGVIPSTKVMYMDIDVDPADANTTWSLKIYYTIPGI